jgi:hypothetical protein
MSFDILKETPPGAERPRSNPERAAAIIRGIGFRIPPTSLLLGKRL